MTKGEAQLREAFDRAILNGADEAEDFIRILKLGNFYIGAGHISEVSHSEWLDWEDGEIFRFVCYEDPEENEDE